MSNRDLLARITTNKPGVSVLACRVVLVAAAVLLVDFVMAEPLLAEPVRAKDEPKYVGDFYGSSVRRQVEIVDDGPSDHRDRDAPVDESVSENKPGLSLPQIRVEDETPVIQVPSEARRPFPASLQKLVLALFFCLVEEDLTEIKIRYHWWCQRFCSG